MAANPTVIETDGRGPQTVAEVDWLAPPRERHGRGARLLDADPELARVLDPDLRERVAPLLRVRIETGGVGRWTPPALANPSESLGLLVLDGLLMRDLAVRGHCCAELLGPGDLLRPWPATGGDGPSDTELEWHVVDGPLLVAVLDRRTSLLVGRVPALVCELLDRTLVRARALQFQLAVSQVHGITDRLELLFWQLADRWGRVTLDGVVLPLNLTHEMLGKLIGARRPSVTTALRRLRDAGVVVRRPDGWLLLH